MVQIVWFKRDLRSIDHRPLAEAARLGTILPLYVAEPDYWAGADVSARQWIATAGALVELRARLAALGAPLVVRVGRVVEVLARINRAVGVSGVFAHQETGNFWTFERDNEVRAFCRAHHIALHETPQNGVVRGLRDRDLWGGLHAAYINAPQIDEPARLVGLERVKLGEIPDAAALGLAACGCARPQAGTRRAAFDLLGGFFAGRGADYRAGMASPLSGASCCSRLSVPLAIGTISIREVLQRAFAERRQAVLSPAATNPIPLGAIDSLIARLHWHCHFMQKLEREPTLEFRAVHKAHEQARLPTRADDPALEAWATGMTGYPFIDACMRSLIATGWLNFRARAMVMSFASYHLGLDWQASGSRLARLFTDYEPGIHWPQVQMQAGATGINTPRIYNPIKQGQDQDKDGIFTRRWVPELADVPLAYLHEPWLMGGVASYPPPLVEHLSAIRAARARLSDIRGSADYRATAQHVFARHGSRRRTLNNDHPGKFRPTAKTRRKTIGTQTTLDL